jgi:hypothetical protein
MFTFLASKQDLPVPDAGSWSEDIPHASQFSTSFLQGTIAKMMFCFSKRQVYYFIRPVDSGDEISKTSKSYALFQK